MIQHFCSWAHITEQNPPAFLDVFIWALSQFFLPFPTRDISKFHHSPRALSPLNIIVSACVHLPKVTPSACSLQPCVSRSRHSQVTVLHALLPHAPAPPPLDSASCCFPGFPSRGYRWTLLWWTFSLSLIDLTSPWHLTGLVTASECFSPTLASWRFSPAGPPLRLLVPSVLWLLFLCPLLNAGVPRASLGPSFLFLPRH